MLSEESNDKSFKIHPLSFPYNLLLWLSLDWVDMEKAGVGFRVVHNEKDNVDIIRNTVI